MFIGNVELKNNVFLAPMAGVTDKPYRTICINMGCGLTYSEMVSAKGLFYNSANTEKLMECDENSRPYAIQLFGSEPEIMGSMAKRIEDMPFDVVKLVSKINFDNVDMIMFCTKNPLPIIPYLKEINKPILFHITLTPYKKDIEPNVIDKTKIIEGIKEISKTA